MKKTISFILLLCMVLSLAACATEESEPTEITLQEVYDAGKTYTALLGDHENMHILITSNGTVIQEDYFSKECLYSFLSAEYMNMGMEYTSFATDHAEYVCIDNIYALNVTLTPDGLVDMKESFAQAGARAFIASEVVTDDSATITEQDGSIIVTSTADMDEITLIGEGVVSCVETYILDAKTREMTSVKTVYTFEDGTVEEGIVTIARDTEMPEGVKPFLAYEQETANLRTVTIVSNPGTANEKTESIQVPVGLDISISANWDVAEAYTLYADAACTQPFENWDANADLTIYVKWGE